MPLVFGKPVIGFARQGFAKVVGGYVQLVKGPPAQVQSLGSTIWQPSYINTTKNTNHPSAGPQHGYSTFNSHAATASADDGQNEREWLANQNSRRLVAPVSSHSIPLAPLDYRSSEDVESFAGVSEVKLHDTQTKLLLSAPASELESELQACYDSSQYPAVLLVWEAMKRDSHVPSVDTFNRILDSTRKVGKASALHYDYLIGCYSDMLGARVVPNTATYEIVIDALCERTITLKASVDEPDLLANHIPNDGVVDNSPTTSKDTLLLALSVFNSTQNLDLQKFDVDLYNRLLTACTVLGEVEGAFHVYKRMEATGVTPSTDTFLLLMQAFSSSGQIAAVIEIYNEFKNEASELNNDDAETNQIYSTLIEAYFKSNRADAAVAFVSKAIDKCDLNNTPVPYSAVNAVIDGFVSLGDYQTAYAWANEVSHGDGTQTVPLSTWCNMLSAATTAGDYATAYPLYNICTKASTGLDSMSVQHCGFMTLAISNRDFEMAARVWAELNASSNGPDFSMARMYSQTLAQAGHVEKGLEVFFEYCRGVATSQQNVKDIQVTAEQLLISLHRERLLSFHHSLSVLNAQRALGINMTLKTQKVLVTSLHSAMESGDPGSSMISDVDLMDIVRMACKFVADPDFISTTRRLLYIYISREKVLNIDRRPNAGEPPDEFSQALFSAVLSLNDAQLYHRWQHFVQQNTAHSFDGRPTSAAAPDSLASSIQWNEASVDLIQAIHRMTSPQKLMSIFRGTRKRGALLPAIYAELITYMGKLKLMKLVSEVYEAGLQDLHTFPLDVQHKTRCLLFNAMIIAHCSVGKVSTARGFQQQLMQIGGTPSASAFAAYIINLPSNGVTDEAAAAIQIFQESQSLHVQPNAFLFNTLLSKLSRARRSEEALIYYEKMRAEGIAPTNVTFGTMISACCRVGNEAYAKDLFDTMESENTASRVAPYNTMMQFYVQNKRDRAAALEYYGKIRARSMVPTAHTYKLLIDAYGSLDPPDMHMADDVLKIIRSDGQKVMPVHHAALIHARGCVLHDCHAAESYFASAVTSGIEPDESMYQALIESLVANHQTGDAMRVVSQMKSRGMRLTPYIANTLIHGWALDRDLPRAKEVFSELRNGVRPEPSTYEAMARAYLSAGDRAGVDGILQEMLSRGYPVAVINRVSTLVDL